MRARSYSSIDSSLFAYATCSPHQRSRRFSSASFICAPTLPVLHHNVQGKPKSFSDNGELIVLDASGGLRSSYSSIPGTSGSAGGTSTAPLQPIGGSGVKSSSATFVPSNIQLLGFDEDDYMVDNSTPLDYSATLADFNTHAGLLTTTFDSLIDEPHLTESQFQGELFDLVHSYQSAMIGFEARETSATPPPSAAHDNERALSNDPKVPPITTHHPHVLHTCSTRSCH